MKYIEKQFCQFFAVRRFVSANSHKTVPCWYQNNLSGWLYVKNRLYYRHLNKTCTGARGDYYEREQWIQCSAQSKYSRQNSRAVQADKRRHASACFGTAVPLRAMCKRYRRGARDVCARNIAPPEGHAASRNHLIASWRQRGLLLYRGKRLRRLGAPYRRHRLRLQMHILLKRKNRMRFGGVRQISF